LQPRRAWLETGEPVCLRRLEEDQFDLRRFERLRRDGAAAAADGRHQAAAELLGAALAAWR
jgi:phage terminase Nu1 subunit (DNA packaging protein)